VGDVIGCVEDEGFELDGLFVSRWCFTGSTSFVLSRSGYRSSDQVEAAVLGVSKQVLVHKECSPRERGP
jgi:hypothetical protein